MTRLLITPSLYSAYVYYTDTEFLSDEAEAAARQDFIDCLNKVSKTNEILQRGINFENSVKAVCDGLLAEPMENAADVAEVIGKGGMWQEKLSKDLGGVYLMYGRADVIKGDTIYDIKRVNKYDCPKYGKSIQHLVYMYCSGLPNFKYVISDGRNVYCEDYNYTADLQGTLMYKVDSMVDFINMSPEFAEPFHKNWIAKEY